MKKRNIPVILLLPLLSLSCSLSHKMERSISKVGLSPVSYTHLTLPTIA